MQMGKIMLKDVEDQELVAVVKKAVEAREKSVGNMRELQKTLNVSFDNISNLPLEIRVFHEGEVYYTSVEYVEAGEGFFATCHYEVKILNNDNLAYDKIIMVY